MSQFSYRGEPDPGHEAGAGDEAREGPHVPEPPRVGHQLEGRRRPAARGQEGAHGLPETTVSDQRKKQVCWQSPRQADTLSRDES